MAAETTPVLRVQGIRKSFSGTEVLHGVGLEALPGRVVALLGENGAGKSTLVKIIGGDYQPDAGSIRIAGEEHAQLNPITSRGLGIRMIYQELNDASTLTVAENIHLGRLPRRAGFVRWDAVRTRSQAILDELGVDIDPNALMGSLSVGERQVIEIARALSDDASVLILDEPTAALSGDEVNRLFEFVERLRSRGTAMIYITHRLDEVRRIADDVVVLRDGDVALQGPASNYQRRDLVTAMVGAAVDDVQRPQTTTPAPDSEPAVELRDATSGGAFTEVDLDVRPGEVVGLYGKIGSGIAEVAEAVFGIRPFTTGSIAVLGEAAPPGPRQAIDRGVGFLPPDRKREGAFLQLSSARNLTAPTWARDAAGGIWANRDREVSAFETWRDALAIRVSPSGANRPIALLSGGNQQKVMLARWLHAESQLLLLVEPTRGVDVGARQEIYTTIRDLAASGRAVLVASSDYEEVIQVADRAVVMSGGRVVRQLDSGDVSVHTLTDAAGG